MKKILVRYNDSGIKSSQSFETKEQLLEIIERRYAKYNESGLTIRQYLDKIVDEFGEYDRDSNYELEADEALVSIYIELETQTFEQMKGVYYPHDGDSTDGYEIKVPRVKKGS